MENTSLVTKKRRKKLPHKLYLCDRLEDLQVELNELDIDLQRLVFEFVKPKSDPAIVITGSLANGIGTQVSDLDVVVLLPSLSSVRNNVDQILGNKVYYLPHSNKSRMEVSLFLNGVEIDIFFMANQEVTDYFDSKSPKAQLGEMSPEDDYQMVFMGRLQNSWVLRNKQLVDQWKEFYQIDKYRVNRIVSIFTRATKNLEDMHVSIGLGVGCVGILGASITGNGLKSLLAFNGFCFISSKWMRKVNYYIHHSEPNMSKLMEHGRELMFPGLLESVEDETEYFKTVYEFIKDVQSKLSNEELIRHILENVEYELDLML
jgi:hypothetical protein